MITNILIEKIIKEAHALKKKKMMKEKHIRCTNYKYTYTCILKMLQITDKHF